MILAHLSDLHLGFRAYERDPRGRNVREGDVAAVFERAVEELAGIGPGLVVVTGDVFDRPDPPPGALVTLTRGLHALRSALPDTPVVLVAGARDTPRDPLEPVVLDAVAGLEGVHVATEAVGSATLLGGSVHACLVPFRALLADPLPELGADPDARWNVLVVHGRTGKAGRLLSLDPEPWSYIALGGEHGARPVAPGAWYAGALERVGREPWQDAAADRGFLTWDLEEGRSRFHPLRGRPVVALAPVRAPGEAEALRRRVGEVTGEVPGGIQDKIVHLTLRDVPPRALLDLQGEPLAGLRRAALHVLVEVEDAAAPPPDVAARVAEVLGEGVVAAPPGAPSPGAAPPGADGAGSGGVLALLPGAPGDPRGEAERLLGASGPGPLAVLAPGSGPQEALRSARRCVLAAWGGPPLEEAIREAEATWGRAPDGADPVERARRLSALDGAPEELRTVELELRRLRADHAEAAGDLEEATMEWLRERQDAETQLHAYRDRARELKGRLARMEAAGSEAACPTCGRILGEHHGHVLGELRDEWEAVVQDGSWWKRRREQLELKPESLQLLENRTLRLQADTEEQAERVERARFRVRELDELRGVGRSGSPAAATLAGLEEEAGRWVLDRGSMLVNRLTGGRLIALGEGGAGRVRLEGWDARLARPGRDDLAAATVALVLAGAWCASQAGAAPSTLVLGDAFDALSGEDRQRCVDLLVEAAPRIGRIAVVTASDVVDRRPEAFEAVLRPGPGGEPAADPRPAGLRIG